MMLGEWPFNPGFKFKAAEVASLFLESRSQVRGDVAIVTARPQSFGRVCSLVDWDNKRPIEKWR